ncbi:hypothetical protein BO82DRAFT_397294 [Aspergillus uvarum CBS 121591]|uniref:Uncharacterized protein n=1 Tax=Aspergillus uvarum CBS 121591 TaxID=1448315 RepID=A0A319D716_9EURO|nr:hypothetical protein BO82DRAFT_397294 [Aspergillus uvarum CBS 121591]PYH86713.1 hypothetical protein BO82DRAFT_397294 [Aspergillus uvarum CBS 121591]
MLDTKIVKYDGSVVWDSMEPDFGHCVVVDASSGQAPSFPYPQNNRAVSILVPREGWKEVGNGIENFLFRPVSLRTTMFLYVVQGRLLQSIGTDENMLVIHAFDANGEEYGRAHFQWALDFPGAIDQTKS